MATQNEIKRWQALVGAAPDGAPGGKTFEATVAWLAAGGHLLRDADAAAMRSGVTPPPSDERADVIFEAQSHVGKWTESDVDTLWREVGVPNFVGHWHDKSWCGAFALRCLRRTLPACADWTWKPGVGFLEVHGLKKVSLPEPGDVAYYGANQHHAIVVSAQNGHVTIVNGNGMPAPLEGVTITTRPISDAAAYYSLRGLT
jgi:hypothetical protein